ncbi:MAG: indole-3-glycerol phosphate synthase TrpC [bacterium]
MSILNSIIEYKQKEVEKLKAEHPISQQRYDFENCSNNFPSNVKKSGISIIAEVKRKSPSAGNLKKNFNPVIIAEMYKKSGADAVSVLTDKKFFGGDNSHLSSIKNKIKIPVLRKDFIIDPYQVYESKIIGADCILLIAGILEKNMLKDLITITGELGMAGLIEVHSEKEIGKSLKCGAEIIGVNNRDLSTFKVNIEKSLQLGRMIPDNIMKISESGIRTASQINKLYEAGFDGVLIGEAFMKASDPGKLIQNWKQICRSENSPITKSYFL